MPVPKSVIKLKKDGVIYESSCDKAQYTIRELTRAALRDVGKFIVRRCNERVQDTIMGMKKNPRVRGKNSVFQYWARSKECDLQVGVKANQWYGFAQELGGTVLGGKSKTQRTMKKLGIITDVTQSNIPEIVKIESQYLSALEDEATALSLISEEDYMGGADE